MSDNGDDRADLEGKVKYEEPRCVGCGCTDFYACDNGCRWIYVSRRFGVGVCSNCKDKKKEYVKLVEEFQKIETAKDVDHGVLI